MNIHFGVKDEAYKTVIGQETAAIDAERFQEKHIDLVSVKKQHAAFQLLLKSSENFLLSVSPSACFNKRGHMDTLRLDVTFEEAGSEMIGRSMKIVGFAEDDDRQLKADILLNDDSVCVEKGRVQPVWFELYIPEAITAGKYNGKVSIYHHKGFEPEEKQGEVSFTIDVKNVTLPDSSQYGFYLDLWQHNSNIARKHEVSLWSDEHFNVIEKYIASLAALGQKAITVIASEIPWSGQFCYRDVLYPSNLFEYNMIRVEKSTDGKLITDFSVVDRYIDLCFNYEINREIEIFGLLNIWMCEEEGFGCVIKDYSDGIRVRYLDKCDNCYKYIDTVTEIKTYIQAIEKHFLDRGLMDRVRVTADEPSNIQIYLERLSFLKETAPSFKYKAALNHAEFIRENQAVIEDFVPVLSAVCSEYDSIKEMKKNISGRICWYVCCCPPLPNTFIRSNLLESVAIGMLTDYIGLDGFLRWNYTVWPENPRGRLSYRYPDWSAGDTNFVYPGNNGAPLLSLRYKALLKGIQMFELISMLRRLNSRANEILSEAYKKVFRFGNINEFLPDSGKKLDELISVKYSDYTDAMKIIVSGLE